MLPAIADLNKMVTDYHKTVLAEQQAIKLKREQDAAIALERVAMIRYRDLPEMLIKAAQSGKMSVEVRCGDEDLARKLIQIIREDNPAYICKTYTMNEFDKFDYDSSYQVWYIQIFWTKSGEAA